MPNTNRRLILTKPQYGSYRNQNPSLSILNLVAFLLIYAYKRSVGISSIQNVRSLAARFDERSLRFKNYLLPMDVDGEWPIEGRVVEFYNKALQSLGLLDPKTLSDDCIARLQNAYSFQTLRSGTSVVDFGTEGMRLAYVAKYGPCFAGAAAVQLRSFLSSEIDVFWRKMTAEEVFTLCCLGGGSATEAVAFTVAIDLILAGSDREEGQRLKVKVIIVDIEPAWSDTARTIVGLLQELPKDPVLDFEFSFVEQDLTKPLSDDCKAALEGSDLVTMVKLMSAIYGSRVVVDSSRMIQEIVAFIPEGGLLFFLDSVGFLEYSSIRDLVSSSEGMQLKHLRLSDRYRLSTISVIKRMLHFGKDLYGHATHNHVHAWKKRPV